MDTRDFCYNKLTLVANLILELTEPSEPKAIPEKFYK